MQAPSPHVLVRDPTAETEVHRLDNRFVPLRASDLARALEDELGAACGPLGSFAGALQDVVDQEIAAFERALADAYAPFNPDCETTSLHPLEHLRTTEAFERLTKQIDYLLDKANFERLSEVQIEAAIRTANTYGLRVRLDPSRVEQMSIWVRGRGTLERQRKTLRAPLRGRLQTLPVFRRLVVVVRLSDDPHVIVKMFKDIPEQDVEALLPHAEVTMNWRDRLMLFGGGAGALGSTGMKALNLVAVAITKLLWVVVVGLATLSFRTFMGYRRARVARDWQRTRHLYYQNLSNNAGAIHRLLAMIAQEETKEALLAYAFLQHPEDPPGRADQRLRERVGAYLQRRFDAEVDFDARDALETISRLRLWNDASAARVLPPDQAIPRLRDHWHQRRSADYHLRKCGAGSPGESSVK